MLADQARADAFVRRQLLLSWAAGLVVLVVLGGMALVLTLTPEPHEAPGVLVAAGAVGVVVLGVLLLVLVRNLVRLATFVFRKEIS